MEEIFEIRNCIEISANDIKIYTIYQYNKVFTVNKEFQGRHIDTGDLHPLRGKSGSDMYDHLFSGTCSISTLLPTD